MKRLVNNIVGPQIRRLRVNKNWSQGQLAAKLQMAGWDISRGTVAKLESGLHCVREYQMFFLMRVFAVTYRELLPASIDPHSPDLFEKLSARLNSRY